ncbi:hypothetical protein F5879DRAFT_923258 [Lentinula edodes]|nr:hypothetical protein F5879DRAFT_923258 [Lentinula edodes]
MRPIISFHKLLVACIILLSCLELIAASPLVVGRGTRDKIKALLGSKKKTEPNVPELPVSFLLRATTPPQYALVLGDNTIFKKDEHSIGMVRRLSGIKIPLGISVNYLEDTTTTNILAEDIKLPGTNWHWILEAAISLSRYSGKDLDEAEEVRFEQSIRLASL